MATVPRTCPWQRFTTKQQLAATSRVDGIPLSLIDQEHSLALLGVE